MPKIPKATAPHAHCPRWCKNPNLKNQKRLSQIRATFRGAGCVQKTVLLLPALFSDRHQLTLAASVKVTARPNPLATIASSHPLHGLPVTTFIPIEDLISITHQESHGAVSGLSQKLLTPIGDLRWCRGRASDLFPVVKIEWHRALLHDPLSRLEEKMCIGENSVREKKHIRLILPESRCVPETINHRLLCLSQVRDPTSQKN